MFGYGALLGLTVVRVVPRREAVPNESCQHGYGNAPTVPCFSHTMVRTLLSLASSASLLFLESMQFLSERTRERGRVLYGNPWCVL